MKDYFLFPETGGIIKVSFANSKIEVAQEKHDYRTVFTKEDFIESLKNLITYLEKYAND